jgi:hypothetical protein
MDLSDISWNELDSGNSMAPPNGWPEGQLPDTVNNCARMMMGSLKRSWDRYNATVTTTGSPGVFLYTTVNASYPGAYVDGEVYTFFAHQASVGGDTFAINLLAALPIYRTSIAPIAAGDIGIGTAPSLVYLGSLNLNAGGFLLLNPFVPLFNDGSGGANFPGSVAVSNNLSVTNNLSVSGAINGTVETLTGALTIGNYLHFAGSSGAVNTTGGPLIYADTTNMAFKVGSGNGSWLFQNYAGANEVTISSAGGINCANLTASGNVSANNMTINGLSLINNGSWLQAVNLRGSSNLYTDGNLGVVGNATVNGSISGTNITANGGLGVLYPSVPYGNYWFGFGWDGYTHVIVNGGDQGRIVLMDGAGTLSIPNDMHCNWAYCNHVQCGGDGSFGGNISAGNITGSGNLTMSNGGGTFGNTGIGYLQIANNYLIPFADDWGIGAGKAFVGMEAYGFYNASDPRLKQDIAQAPVGALDKVCAIPVINYRLKTRASEPLRTGFSADDVKQQFSGAVKVGDDADQTLSINLMEMIANLWQAVQELSIKVADLQAAR